ncbi:hypothetical protein [Dictyobacter arantiisoli]|uniref:Uncharacterized protein n=1 Tax=Dictyobacter arantiisoli TaxID=2014874 RepID=A0A5A5TIL3_9CHLR|nr:hypothetical protein [Dictyobacter arantiisoli]GCF10893.1 hypothetical protein KDI_44570 [Dictyobacter arantiisoli]
MPDDEAMVMLTTDVVNERAMNLVNAPISGAPRTVLETAREINQAIERNLNGHNYGVYATGMTTGPTIFRIYQARTQQGRLQVRSRHGWIIASLVYSEG